MLEEEIFSSLSAQLHSFGARFFSDSGISLPALFVCSSAIILKMPGFIDGTKRDWICFFKGALDFALLRRRRRSRHARRRGQKLAVANAALAAAMQRQRERERRYRVGGKLTKVKSLKGL